MGRVDGYIYRAVELTHAASDFCSHRPKNDRLSENCILRPLRFARSDVTMHQRTGIISGLQVVLRLGYHLVQE